MGGRTSLSTLTRQGPWPSRAPLSLVGFPDSLSPQLHLGREGLLGAPGPWRRRRPGLRLGQRGQREQRTAREQAATGSRAEAPAQPGPVARLAAAAGRNSRLRARTGAAAVANTLSVRHPGNPRERGAPAVQPRQARRAAPSAAAPPSRRAPVARRPQLPGCLPGESRPGPAKRPQARMRARRIPGQLGDR